MICRLTRTRLMNCRDTESKRVVILNSEFKLFWISEQLYLIFSTSRILSRTMYYQTGFLSFRPYWNLVRKWRGFSIWSLKLGTNQFPLLFMRKSLLETRVGGDLCGWTRSFSSRNSERTYGPIDPLFRLGRRHRQKWTVVPVLTVVPGQSTWSCSRWTWHPVYSTVKYVLRSTTTGNPGNTLREGVRDIRDVVGTLASCGSSDLGWNRCPNETGCLRVVVMYLF